jgi:large subunit ribosomal protein L21
VLRHGKGPKLDVFTFKAKENRKRSLGHRQPYTELRVEAIAAGRAE